MNCRCPAVATMEQVETAQKQAPGAPGVGESSDQAREHRREGVAILLAVAGALGVWVGSRLINHWESIWIPLIGFGLLAVGWLAWKALHES